MKRFVLVFVRHSDLLVRALATAASIMALASCASSGRNSVATGSVSTTTQGGSATTTIIMSAAASPSACRSSQLSLFYAEAESSSTPTPVSNPGPGVLYAVGTNQALFPLLVRNVSSESCYLRGYMVPVWDNVPGSPSVGTSQRVLASHAILNRHDTGPFVAVATVQLASGESAAFIVQVGGNEKGVVRPGAYAPPDDSRPVPAPGRSPSGTAMDTFAETAVFPATHAVVDYCDILQGNPTCAERP